ncbi:glycoside hydrolase/deacetylase [Testicularia cyperi]|uniref:Glycoside hydrolase/deacetylase n=1 Tax=Testicularia cyperi TaxID=1882483 RepID=A0A317XQ32_9BASI|nr:glycoside hydrolase/deacetylase [Testicularia cyperi]
MRFTSFVAAAIGLVMAGTSMAKPTVMSSIPDTLSPAVRRELSHMDPSEYQLFERDNLTTEEGGLHKRAQINGLQTRCTSSKCMSITFDDGAYNWHKKLANLFDQNGSKATFFVNGNNFDCIYNDARVSALRYSYERGHQICSHTWSHPNLASLSNSQLDRQVQLVEDALWKIIGAVPSCIRAPYGSITDAQVKYLNDRWGLVVVGWNFDSNDANGYGVDYALNVYRGLKAPKHAIVLNHETVETTPNTVMPQALQIIKQNGYSGSQTVASTLGFNPYKVVGQYQNRDSSWTCDGKPAPGAA